MYQKCSYGKSELNGSRDHVNNGIHEIDLRSDTVSRPTNAMRDAMRNAIVGDDVYGEDPTVKQLEEKAAAMLGKEKGLFVPSGTMANIIAIMVHCDKRGSELFCGDKSHTYLFEQGGASQIAGVLLSTLVNNPDGTFSLDELEQKLHLNPDEHEPFTNLCIFENTHNMCGGRVLPLDWVDSLAEICKKNKIKLHMDGARLFNAAVAIKCDAKELVKHCDSACFCLSKSLCCPVGSVLVGSNEFIHKARRMRKVLGGGMRQVGIIAAAGLVALDHMIDRLSEDHARAYAIAESIHNLKSTLFTVDLKSIETNMFMLFMDPKIITAREFIKSMVTISEEEHNNGVNIIVKCCSRFPEMVRFTIYNEITDNDVKLVIKKVTFVIKQFEKILLK